MRVVLMAPHQDDEILNSFYDLCAIQDKKNIFILFVTNGDHHSKEEATLRYRESIKALSLCGISTDNIYYLGYADTGMKREHSFLYRLYHAELDSIIASPQSFCTYHPFGLKTVHSLLYGMETSYTKRNFIKDIKDFLHLISPEKLVLPSAYDNHGDHAALACFMRKIISSDSPLTIKHYLIHSENDVKWPPRNTDAWIRPDCVPEYVWNKRTINYATPELIMRKKQAILGYQSQNPYGMHEYLLSFVKSSEFYIPL